MRQRRHKSRGYRLLAVVAALEAGVERVQGRRRATAFAMGDERRGDVGACSRHVRREAERGVERVLERSGVGDDGERADPLLPGRELELARRGIAVHDHVVDRRRRTGAEAVPDLEALEQVD